MSCWLGELNIGEASERCVGVDEVGNEAVVIVGDKCVAVFGCDVADLGRFDPHEP